MSRTPLSNDRIQIIFTYATHEWVENGDRKGKIRLHKQCLWNFALFIAY